MHKLGKHENKNISGRKAKKKKKKKKRSTRTPLSSLSSTHCGESVCQVFASPTYDHTLAHFKSHAQYSVSRRPKTTIYLPYDSQCQNGDFYNTKVQYSERPQRPFSAPASAALESTLFTEEPQTRNYSEYIKCSNKGAHRTNKMAMNKTDSYARKIAETFTVI